MLRSMVGFGHSVCQAKNQESNNFGTPNEPRWDTEEQYWQSHDFWSTILSFPVLQVARLTSFDLRTDPPAKCTLTRSRHATNSCGLRVQPAPVTKNPGFVERRRFFRFVRLRGDNRRQREGAGWRAV